MGMTNAERQARYRERHKGTAGLSAAQIADRDAVMAGPLLPLRYKDEGPTFMGLGRQGWRACSVELVKHFGMREAWDRWQAEWENHLERSREAGERARGIVAEVGRRASKILQQRGAVALCAAYDADPTLGARQRKA